MTIKIGTRKSKLALWQAYYVQQKLEQGGLSTEIVAMETKGDKIQDVTIAKIGSKGVFTEEIEAGLKSGDIDIAVHSAKDMQSVLPEGFEIIAFCERERVNDVLVSHNPKLKLHPEASFTIGTSSTRRIALLRHYFPKIKTVDMRGNLQTRLRKLEEGQCDALLLAYAGVHRMGYDTFIVDELPTDIFTPPVGQGSVAIEVAKSMAADKKTKLKSLLNDPKTHACLVAERSYLRILEGGCSIPSFALAQMDGTNITLSGGLVNLSGSKIIRKQVTGGVDTAEDLGINLANYILQHGGEEILQEIKKEQP